MKAGARAVFRLLGVLAALAVVILVLGGRRLQAEYYFLRLSWGGNQQEWSYALEELGSAATPALLRLLKDRDPLDRARAAEVLQRQSSPEVVDALVALARSDPEPLVRHEALRSLGFIGDARAVPGLAALAPRNSWAQEALARMGPAGKQVLLEIFRADPDPQWRAAALSKLCAAPAGNQPDVRAEAKAALADPAAEVRAAAVACVAQPAR